MIQDWFWVQYTGGAGGKLLCALLQLSEKVHVWDESVKSNLSQFIDKRIRIDRHDHMKKEIHFPYDLHWYSRQLPFKRGDDLTNQQAQTLFDTYNNISHGLILNMLWVKPYLPNWFNGNCITIINDPRSLSFLRKRRDALFYEWEGNTVSFKRFIPEKCGNTRVAQMFSDHPELKKTYVDRKKFYQEHFYDHPEVIGLMEPKSDPRIGLTINLSDFWLGSGRNIARKINSKYGLGIDLDKADLLIDAWVRHNKDLI